MVKCPTATPQQLRANLAHQNKVNSVEVEVSESIGEETIEETLVQESVNSEWDSNRADKRHPPTPRDELVYIFINCFLDTLLERWEGKPCLKQKFKTPEPESEVYGEDLGPCEISTTSSTDDPLKDLYQKRSSSLSKEKPNEYAESNPSEYLSEDDFDSVGSPEGLKKPAPDEDVYFSFPNGTWYKGRVSRRLMEGDGYYFWNDGATFKGEFEDGYAMGKGRLEFPNMCVYEGDVYKAFRHGEGMFWFPDSPVMYSGQWWLGKKHGHGLIVYNEPSEGHNYYRGQWQDGFKEGFGFRQYPSGARYVGFWSNGKRHGKGVMFWSNNDIYRGEWNQGLMHGYGEYTWNAFNNNTLSYPTANIYRGQWEHGKRNGVGLLELKTGCFIETVWVNNIKEGYGAVICKNGAVVSSELLFVRDKPAVFPIGLSEGKDAMTYVSGTGEDTIPKKKLQNEEAFTEYSSRTKMVKAIHVPINAPVHTLNLAPHTQKFFLQKRAGLLLMNEEARLRKNFKSMTPQKDEPEEPEVGLTDVQRKQLNESLTTEEHNLRNFIIFNSATLKLGYDYYAKLACDKQTSTKCTLLRLFLWQMLLDGGVPNPDLSLVDIDDLIASEEFLLIHDSHSPFEQIQFWQFLQILILLSWHLYGQYVFGELPFTENPRLTSFLKRFNPCEINNVLKMALQHLIENDLFWDKFLQGAEPPPKQRKFEENDFAPMEAMYHIYCSLGKPHSARDFLNLVCLRDPAEGADIIPVFQYFEKLPFSKIEGKNAMTIGGELQHIPQHDPLNFPELFQLEGNRRKKEPKFELTCFRGLGAKRVMSCLVEACPGILREDCIVNVDYQLTFLEFYRTVILCAKLHLKMKIMKEVKKGLMAEYRLQMEEYRRQLAEYEKARETPVVSGKKSRQGGDNPRKGRKN